MKDIDKYAALRDEAMARYESAAADYERFNAMDNSEFANTAENRFQSEEKSLELKDRTAALGQHLHDNDTLVKDEDKELLSETRSGFFNAQHQIARESGTSEIELSVGQYDNHGLSDTHENLDELDVMLSGVVAVVEASGFEEASLAYDEMTLASEETAAVSNDNQTGSTVTASYQDMTNFMSADHMGEDTSSDFGNAALLLDGNSDELSIDFGNLTEEQALGLYESHSEYKEDLDLQRDEFKSLGVNDSRLDIYDNANSKILEELEKQYGLSPEDLK